MTNVSSNSPAAFDYGAEAELFPTRRWKSARRSFAYRRFGNAAEAVRFAVEELPPELLSGAYLEVDEARFDAGGIRKLYDSAEYPLPRKKAARPAVERQAAGSFEGAFSR
jgi:hypothetical protein